MEKEVVLMLEINKIHNFIENKLLSRKFEPFLFSIYVLLALIILNFKIKNLLSIEFLSYLVIGLIALKAAVFGVRDKDLWARTVKMSKKESIRWGYISFFISVIILLMLYYRVYIWSS